MIAFNPVAGKDIRVVFNRDTSRFEVQQERLRTAYGMTDPNDIAGVIGYFNTDWSRRSESEDVTEILQEAFAIAYQEDVVIRSVDLGPTSPQSVVVARAVALLGLLTL